VSEKPYWFADWDEEGAVGEYGWAPFLETREGHIPAIRVWFQTKSQCEDWIREYVIGAELETE
jgi:hypothetical protein